MIDTKNSGKTTATNVPVNLTDRPSVQASAVHVI